MGSPSRRVAALAAVAAALALPAAPALAQEKGSLNLLCSTELEWCALMSGTFEKETGIKVNMVRKSSGEVLAQLIAERANPKTDVWFGGTGDPHLQAAEQDLTQPHNSALQARLHDWAQRFAQASGNRSAAVYLGPLGLAYNPEVLARAALRRGSRLRLHEGAAPPHHRVHALRSRSGEERRARRDGRGRGLPRTCRGRDQAGAAA
jgi:iron(III) transport system substrate-binding protein